jgi:hypothetical protein
MIVSIILALLEVLPRQPLAEAKTKIPTDMQMVKKIRSIKDFFGAAFNFISFTCLCNHYFFS